MWLAHHALSSDIGRLYGAVLSGATLRGEVNKWTHDCFNQWLFIEHCSSGQENLAQLNGLSAGYFCREAFLTLAIRVTYGLTVFWGETAASRLLLSLPGGQGSILKMDWLYPVIRKAISVREYLGQRGRNTWLLVEVQSDKDIMGSSPALLPCFP